MRRNHRTSPPLLPFLVVLALTGPAASLERSAQTRTTIDRSSRLSDSPIADGRAHESATELSIEPPTPSELGLGSSWGFDVEISGLGLGRLTRDDRPDLLIHRTIPEAWTYDLHRSDYRDGRFSVDVEVIGATGTPDVLDNPADPDSQVRVVSAATRYTTSDLGHGWIRLVGDVDLQLDLGALHSSGNHTGSLRITVQTF